MAKTIDQIVAENTPQTTNKELQDTGFIDAARGLGATDEPGTTQELQDVGFQLAASRANPKAGVNAVDPIAAAAAAEAEAARIAAANKKTEDLSDAYAVLETEMTALGLGSLVTDAKDLLLKVTNVRDMPAALRNTPDYKKRFIANEARILKGLRPLTPAEYLDKEDAYQNIMREYGLPESYWKTDKLGGQEGFTKLLENNVSVVELEDRVQTAQERVLKSSPEIMTALKRFYGDTITNGDILAYTLDPKNALKDIQRKVTAAEIGGAAIQAGFGMTKMGAEDLERAGVTGLQYQKAAPVIGETAARGAQLAEIYQQTPYTQQTAEQAVLNVPGSVEALKQTRKLTELEKASFSKSTGMAKGALDRERAGNL